MEAIGPLGGHDLLPCGASGGATICYPAVLLEPGLQCLEDELDRILRGGTRKVNKFPKEKTVVGQLDVGMCNTGGVPGIHRILGLVKSGKLYVDVIMIQETKVTETEQKVIETIFANLGYYTYWQSGEKHLRESGGVMTAVKKIWKQKLVEKAGYNSAQCVTVEVEGWHISNWYNPPRDAEHMHQLLMTTMIGNNVQARDKWFCGGDWNETKEEASANILAGFGIAGVDQMGEYCKPTRFSGDKEIDWFATNYTELVEKVWQSKYKLSDHKILLTRLKVEQKKPRKVGKLDPGPSWKRPKHRTKQQWRAKLDAMWTEFRGSVFQGAFNDLKIVEEGETTDTVEEDWLAWLRLLDRFYRRVFEQEYKEVEETLLNEANDKKREELVEIKEHIKRQLKNSTVKGEEVKVKFIDEPTWTRSEKDKAPWVATHRKFVGRAVSVRCIIKKKTWPIAKQEQEVQNVLKKLRAPGFSDQSEALEWLQKKIETKARQLKAREDRVKAEKLKAWREKMQDLREASRWVKNKSSVCTRLISGATTREEVCQKIREFWRMEWSGQTQSDDGNEVDEALVSPMRSWMADKKVTPWSEEERAKGTNKAFAKARGAAGVDGYLGEEVECLPQGCRDIFIKITRKWIKSEKAPEKLRLLIQASLQKPGKAAEVENIRPIAVFSIFWRIFESGLLLSDDFVRWRTLVGIPEVAWKESAEQVAAMVMNKFAEDEFLGALDFSKAYDFMAPKKSQEIMIAAGIPPAVARLFGEHWMQQVRLVKFDNHLSKEELRTTTAHPQGGPWGPVIIQLWMIAGTLWTKSQFDNKMRSLWQQQELSISEQEPVRKRRKFTTPLLAQETRKRKLEDGDAQRTTKRSRNTVKVYMDDRSIVAKKARPMLAGVMTWEEWSEKVGLRENASKKQLLPKTISAKRELQGELENMGLQNWNKFIVDEAEVLGTVVGNRQLASKEKKRIAKFTERVAWLETVPVSRPRQVLYKRVIAMSALAYGWLCRFPEKKKLDEAAKQMSGKVLQRANPELKNVMEGGILHPMVVLTARLFNMTFMAWQSDISQKSFPWTHCSLHTVSRLRKAMGELGFSEKGEFHWQHTGLQVELEIEKLQGEEKDASKRKVLEARKRKNSHWIREAFRYQAWNRFWAGSRRHEVLQMRKDKVDTAYPMQRLKRARDLASSGAKMSLLCGAFRSPANFQIGIANKMSGKYPDKCVACSEIGGHDHIFWDCEAVRQKFRQSFGEAPVSDDPLQRRYGLPLGTKTSGLYDDHVLRWMELITNEVWDQRYGNTDKKRRVDFSVQKKRRRREEQETVDVLDYADEEEEKWLAEQEAYDDEEL